MSKGEVLPLIALVNSKSGGQDGPRLIRKLQEHVPKENVFDLSEGGPAVGLAKCRNQRTRVLVCGGDGTVSWVLSEIKKLNLDEKLRPVIAILPLGTANDLSRTLKWGPGWTGEKLLPLFSQIDKASVVHMDQWHVVTTTNDANDKFFVMNNYFSVGTDAEVALKFHKKREERPNLFKNRTRNKGYYAKYAVGTFLRAQPLATGIEVELDGNKLELPANLSILLILNTPSYASGINPWGTSKKNSKKSQFTQQTIDDGKFEVVGIKGLLHAGTLQMRVTKGKRLGQGSSLTIKINRPIAAQVDGEPWLQEPTVVKITHGGHAMMLANSPPTGHGPRPAATLTEKAEKAEKAEKPEKPEKIDRTSSSSVVLSLALEGEPLTPAKSKPLVTRTMSSNTISSLHYGPVPHSKRKKNRFYCDTCDFEFFLQYMLDNHKVKGCSLNSSSSSSSSNSPSPVYSAPTTLSSPASAPALMKSGSQPQVSVESTSTQSQDTEPSSSASGTQETDEEVKEASQSEEIKAESPQKPDLGAEKEDVDVQTDTAALLDKISPEATSPDRSSEDDDTIAVEQPEVDAVEVKEDTTVKDSGAPLHPDTDVSPPKIDKPEGEEEEVVVESDSPARLDVNSTKEGVDEDAQQDGQTDNSEESSSPQQEQGNPAQEEANSPEVDKEQQQTDATPAEEADKDHPTEDQPNSSTSEEETTKEQHATPEDKQSLPTTPTEEQPAEEQPTVEELPTTPEEQPTTQVEDHSAPVSAEEANIDSQPNSTLEGDNAESDASKLSPDLLKQADVWPVFQQRMMV